MSNEPAHKPPEEALSPEALKNLTGWFDALIRMDLEQKAKRGRGKDEKKPIDQMYKKV